jgi:hypothetical protein
MKRRIISAVVIALALHASAAWSQDLPEGWRMPTVKEVTDPLREKSSVAFAKATADFTGDGLLDEALLLQSTRFSGEGLWISDTAPSLHSRVRYTPIGQQARTEVGHRVSCADGCVYEFLRASKS